MAEGRRAHRHTAPRKGSSPLVNLSSHAVGIVVAGFAWVYLVRAAMDFGTLAVSGQSVAWLFTLGAALGAVVCLVLVLALVGRGLRMLGYISDYKPRRAGARRRR
jgi:hypothetical protein